MENEIITAGNVMVISGVECYEKEGIVYLKLETVAKGLGWTKTEKKGDKEYTSVRWDRVFVFLDDLGFDHKWGKDDYIPEQAFYLLAMKASNDTARAFQMKVATEILPSIRKHGAYMTEQTIEKALTDPDFLIRLATNLKEEQQKRIEAEAKVEEMKPKALFADAVASSSRSCLVAELAKILKQNGIDTGQNRLFQWLRGHGYLGSKGDYYNQPTQTAMDMGLFEIKKRTIANPDGSTIVTTTTKVTPKGQIYFVQKFLGDLK